MTTSSRDKLIATLNHRQPDRVCVDFGATAVTGIHVSALSRLRRALIGDEDYRVKVIEPYQMLGEIDDTLREYLGIDVVSVNLPNTMFGFRNENWKPFTLFDGTEALVPGNFNVTPDERGGLYIYPEGDTSVPPSAFMPQGGDFFDALCRQNPIREEYLDPADNLEEFALLSEDDIACLSRKSKEVAEKNMGAILIAPGAAFGDIALVPATWMKKTRGIRDVQEWYISTIARRDYVYKVFERQCEIALQNMNRLIDALGGSIQAVFLTGTDFGTQQGLFISKKSYQDLYKPFHKAINDMIHKNSDWKTFIHSCGSVYELIPEFIDAGFDILNPVQCSAAGMDAARLKKEFGRDLVFWGGGVDTQKTLPFGAPDQVYQEVRERIQIFNEGGGFVFNSIHNVQSKVPLENMLAMFRAVKDDGQ
ncbi:methyltransferase [Candidatus Sumerlaeota bacterium]|nr:methyltransferase [Candidatus Sumerlaeota bacterium]